MKLIIYAGSDYLSGDEIADALLEYSRALSGNDAAETVRIPIRNDDGSIGSATFLVGPASQIVAKDVVTELEELRDPAAVADLQRRTGALHLVARPESEPRDPGWAIDEY